jgi:dTDP-glucose 4,6-dehydratase
MMSKGATFVIKTNEDLPFTSERLGATTVKARKMRILITGAAGFAGHHFVEHILKETDWKIVVYDKLTYASMGYARLRDIDLFGDVFESRRVKILGGDFSLPLAEGVKREIGQVDYIVHMGAETHVDNSIKDPKPFVMANVVGTMNMLDFAREQENLKLFVYFSTDEVFGPVMEGKSKEWDNYNSGNPYAATKAGGEELALAYANTYGLPVLITHTMNLFGERQHPEKFIPLVINKVLAGETVYIHADPSLTKPGVRSYIHCRNMSAALLFLLNYYVEHRPIQGSGAEMSLANTRVKMNIVGEKELNNLELAQFVADVVGEPLKYELVDFHGSRPGHDLRYALDGSKLHNMGFEFPKSFETSMIKTVRWTLDNPRWLR